MVSEIHQISHGDSMETSNNRYDLRHSTKCHAKHDESKRNKLKRIFSLGGLKRYLFIDIAREKITEETFRKPMACFQTSNIKLDPQPRELVISDDDQFLHIVSAGEVVESLAVSKITKFTHSDMMLTMSIEHQVLNPKTNKPETVDLIFSFKNCKEKDIMVEKMCKLLNAKIDIRLNEALDLTKFLSGRNPLNVCLLFL
jgi:hypothetical protein